MKLTIEMGKDFPQTIAELSSMGQAVVDACSDGLAKGVKNTANAVIAERLSGKDLKTRTGNLKRAVDGWLKGPLSGVIGVKENSAVDKYKYLLGTKQVTIKPKKAKFLAIPIAEGLTPSGVARYGSPREVDDGFFFKGESGGLFFARRNGKRGKVRLLFVFKKEVTITGSGALLAGVLDHTGDIAEAMTDEIGRRID